MYVHLFITPNSFKHPKNLFCNRIVKHYINFGHVQHFLRSPKQSNRINENKLSGEQ